MKVLSLFDGMSCGKVALKRAERPVSQYFASEIDKYTLTVSAVNHPDIVQLGDVREVRRMAEHGLFGRVDLLIAGSPCQGFSLAGKQLAFDDPRSALFFEFVWTLEALRRLNPNVKFMLENVRMKQEHLDVITKILKVEPVVINSALVSAQNRVRYYWCNWYVPQPEDRGILLKDVIEYPPTGKILSEKECAYMNRAVADGRTHWDFKHHSDTAKPKSATIVANFSKGVPYNVLIDRMKSRCLTASIGRTTVREYFLKRQGRMIGELSPVECERLQGLPDDYSSAVSNTQRYKMLGNGWQVDTIEHIFRNMPT